MLTLVEENAELRKDLSELEYDLQDQKLAAIECGDSGMRIIHILYAHILIFLDQII